MGDNRPAVYVEEDTERVVYRGSSIGTCTKILIASRMGIEAQATPDWMQKKFDEGNRFEDEIIRRFEEKVGVKVVNQQQELEYELLGGKCLIRAHIDGEVRNEALVEVKAFSKSTWEKWERHKFKGFKQYAYQVSLYMHVKELYKLYFVVGVKNADGSAVDEVYVYEFDRPPVLFSDIKKVVNVVEDAYLKQEIPEACDYPAYPCPFSFLHEDDKKEVLEVDDAGVEKLALRLDEIRAQEKGLAEDKKAVTAELVATFDRLGIKGGKVQTDGYVIDDVVQWRKTLDYGAVASAGIELDKYMRFNKETRFVKVRKKK